MMCNPGLRACLSLLHIDAHHAPGMPRKSRTADAKKAARPPTGFAEFSVQADVDEAAEAVVKFQQGAQRILYDTEYPLVMSGTIVVHWISMIAELEIESFAGPALALQYVCAVLFFLEMMLTLVAYGGVIDFWRASQNKIEAFFTACTLLSLVWEEFAFLRYVPAARLFRLMRLVETLDGLLQCAASSAGAIVNLVMFLAMLSFCFAITARYIYGDSMNENTRSHFGSNGIAVLTIFQLVVGDSWSTVLYEGVRVSDTQYSKIFAAAFIISWFTVSKLIIANIFVAVIIENFRVLDTIESAGRPGVIHKFRNIVKESYRNLYAIQMAMDDVDVEYADIKTQNEPQKKSRLAYSFAPDGAGESEAAMQFRSVRNNVHLRSLLADSMEETDAGNARMVSKGDGPIERSLFFFGHDDVLRKLFTYMVHHPFFDLMVYAAITAGCIILVTTPPYEDIPDNPPMLSLTLRVQLEFAFTGIFLFEFIARIVSDGFLFTHKAYLKNNWNRVDGLVLLFGIVDISGLLDGTRYAKVLRVLRALKPLRMMKRLKGLRNLLDALVLTLIPVAYVLAFLMVIITNVSFTGAKVAFFLDKATVHDCHR